jgi:hypothetical protein
MIDLLFFAVAGIALIVGVQRIARWRRRTTGSGPIALQLVALALAFVFLAPATQAFASAVIPSLGRLLSNLCTLVAAFGFIQLQLHVNYPPAEVKERLRPRVVVLIAVLAGLVVAFFLGQRPVGLGVFDYRGQHWLVIYALLYSLYLSVALIDLLRLAVRSVLNTRGYLRAGMAVMGTGYVLGLLYTGSKIQYVIRSALGPVSVEPRCAGPFSSLVCTLSVGLPALSVLVIVIGLSIPTVGRRIDRLAEWWNLRRVYEGLEPLWKAFYNAMPQIALTSPQGVEGQVPRRDMRLRLYRRVVEVRDGALILNPYRRDADTAAHRDRGVALGLDGEALVAAIEAADLAVALGRYTSGASRGGGITPASPSHDDLQGEATSLESVSRAFAERRIAPVEDRTAAER